VSQTGYERVLVTGGGGFLGRAIVRQLIEAGDHVTSFSRQSYAELDRLGVDQIKGDISDPRAMDRAISGMDTVFHVAAKPGIWGKFEDYFAVNVTGTKNVIDACVKNRVKHLIYTSSPSVVFDGNNMEGVDESVGYPETFHAPYPETKAMAERLVRASKSVQTISLRPHLIWGPGDNHLFPGIIRRAGRLRRIGDGTNRVDTIYVDNAARAHILARNALRNDPALAGNVYFISQDEPVLLWAMVDRFLEAAGLEPVKKTIPPGMAFFIGRFFELVYGVLGIEGEPPITSFAAKELSTSHFFDISRAKKDLGYLPLISTEQGLERLGQWVKSGEKR
jgi:nucleoside-diphosphate-sugar epimerase